MHRSTEVQNKKDYSHKVQEENGTMPKIVMNARKERRGGVYLNVLLNRLGSS